MTREQYEHDPLTADEYHAWKQQTTTKKVLFLLRDEQDSLVEEMAFGATLRFGNADETAQMTARQVGVIEGLNKILEMEVTDE